MYMVGGPDRITFPCDPDDLTFIWDETTFANLGPIVEVCQDPLVVSEHLQDSLTSELAGCHVICKLVTDRQDFQ